MTDSTTPELILAVQLKNIEKVRTLLESEEVDVNVTDSFGDTALHFAAALNQLEILKLLVEKGAKVNAQNNTGATPLHKASARDNRQIILHLLPLADITIKTNSGLLAEQFASDVEVWKTIIGQNNLKREKIFIENDNLGTLIGKKGRNLQQLQTISNTRIIVHSKNSSAESGTTEVSITGREEAIAAAKQLIEETFKPKPSKQEQIFEDDDIAHSVKVAAKIARNKYGRIIGAKGKKITEIEDTFGVKVVLPKFEDDEVVTIYGDDSTSVQEALNFIFELIKDKEKPNQDNRNNNQNRNNNNNNNSNNNNNNNRNRNNNNNNNNNGEGRRNNSNNNNPRSSNPKSNSSAQVIKTKDTVVIKTNNYLRANGK